MCNYCVDVYHILYIFIICQRGIAGVSKNRKQRMKAIADVLAGSNYDVVCLQEVWTNRDFFLIRDKVKNVLPYSHYFYRYIYFLIKYWV